MEKRNAIIIRVITLIAFLLMVAVNAMANIIPINGVTTGQVSDSYPNLFAPAGITFAIWGVIYLMLGLYTLYQLGLFQGDKRLVNNRLLNRVGIIFSISSLVNAAWIFAWHYHLIPLSMVLMVVILICLIYIVEMIGRNSLSGSETFFIALPFSIYFGWITVATIANATVLLVSLGWNGFGLEPQKWAIIMISIGILIGAATVLIKRDLPYGLVLIWAYAGIYIKHTSPTGFAGQYPNVITAVLVCIVVMVITLLYVVVSRKRLLL